MMVGEYAAHYGAYEPVFISTKIALLTELGAVTEGWEGRKKEEGRTFQLRIANCELRIGELQAPSPGRYARRWVALWNWAG